MKSALGLNKAGIESAKHFLLKYDKRSADPQYNMSVAVEAISNKACESYSQSYELGSFDTVSGRPETISFKNDELDFMDQE